jgi:hypothetical protein
MLKNLNVKSIRHLCTYYSKKIRQSLLPVLQGLLVLSSWETDSVTRDLYSKLPGLLESLLCARDCVNRDCLLGSFRKR